MACKTSYDLHHNFPKLAEETGFAFNTHRPRIHIDWNKIRLIDIDSLTRDRKFVLIEQHVNDILDCVLESEFDVRILDEGVVKLFRLAQLAVEYQQFCRHYLDRSVFVLRQEIDAIAQELGKAKNELNDKEEELRKLRRKGKPHYRHLLPYGNDNIAAMILKTLTNKGEMFAPNTSGEVPQYNKCNFCDKVFLNQLYLKSHITRRHANLLDEPPQRDLKETDPVEVNKTTNENEKLNEEIHQLKLKIKEMEILITNNNKVLVDSETTKTNNRADVSKAKEMKDAEAFTTNDDVFQKLEEWKKTEQENHSKEINLLRNQIFETLNNLKAKEKFKPNENETKIIDQLHGTIKEQGTEILTLKQALAQSKLKIDNEDKERKKEIEEQMLYWAKRDEAQSKQYELLVQKLNEVAQEARESRALAEAERQRAGQLEALLNKHLSKNKDPGGSTDGDSVSNAQEEYDDPEPTKEPKLARKPKPTVSQNSLEQLHRKAQELLNMETSSSSDASSPESFDDHRAVKLTKNTLLEKPTAKNRSNKNRSKHPETPSKKSNNEINKTKSLNKVNGSKIATPKQKNIKKESKTRVKEVPKPSPRKIIKQENGPAIPPGSPLKVVRAKITEEVNNRLVQAGVDPLKRRLNQDIFQKQKAQLQHQLEIKAKKNPTYEKVRYSIMAYLDTDASDKKKDVASKNGTATPTNLNKVFSLGSVISNVKSKALSLVKNKELKQKNESKSTISEFAKKATRLFKDPPESPTDSNLRYSNPIHSEDDDIVSARNESETTVDQHFTTNLVKRKVTLPTQRNLKIESESDESSNPQEKILAVPQRPARSIDNLIRSPARRPSSASADYSNTVLKYTVSTNDDHLLRTQSVTNVSNIGTDEGDIVEEVSPKPKAVNDDIQALLEITKTPKGENSRGSSPKQTKGVLKNASSTSSLNKKKVLFDMDAIQMKSVSASPSQSLTEKSEDKFDLGLINIADDEWDISSIENDPIKNDTKIRVSTGQSPKIAELKQTIEAQLARRSETPSTALFGGVDVLRGPMTKSSNIGGSNTSLGSSILDDSDSAKVIYQKNIGIVKPKNNIEKDDSELDISDFSIDGVSNKNEKDSF